MTIPRVILRTVCAWCNTVIHEGNTADPRVSHGMCAACEALTDDERDALVRARAGDRHADFYKDRS